MRKSRYSDEQIAAALRQAEIGTPVADITRKLGISEATFYVWKKRFGTLGTPEIRELRQLRDENAKLKSVVADLTLDRAVLQDVLKKKGIRKKWLVAASRETMTRGHDSDFVVEFSDLPVGEGPPVASLLLVKGSGGGDQQGSP